MPRVASTCLSALLVLAMVGGCRSNGPPPCPASEHALRMYCRAIAHDAYNSDPPNPRVLQDASECARWVDIGDLQSAKALLHKRGLCMAANAR